jgi:GNAT superfamily N-acetyltransferase
MKIRPARPDERDALEALQRRASLHVPDYRQALLDHPDAIDLPLVQIKEGRVLVAERDGRLLGFSAALPRPDGDYELDGLFVEPDLWRSGVGAMLVNAACGQARESGARALHVIANPTALGFYERCSFAQTGATETRFGPAPLMRRTLEIDAA